MGKPSCKPFFGSHQSLLCPGNRTIVPCGGGSKAPVRLRRLDAAHHPPPYKDGFVCPTLSYHNTSRFPPYHPTFSASSSSPPRQPPGHYFTTSSRSPTLLFTFPSTTSDLFFIHPPPRAFFSAFPQSTSESHEPPFPSYDIAQSISLINSNQHQYTLFRFKDQHNALYDRCFRPSGLCIICLCPCRNDRSYVTNPITLSQPLH